MQDQFMVRLRAFDGSARNWRLREAMGWDEPTYGSARLALIADALVKPGRRRGTLVALVDHEDVEALATPETTTFAETRDYFLPRLVSAGVSMVEAREMFEAAP